MLDTLMIVLATLPTTRPNMERKTNIVAPVSVALVSTTPRREEQAEKLSTCYEASYGSCWSEN